MLRGGGGGETRRQLRWFAFAPIFFVASLSVPEYRYNIRSSKRYTDRPGSLFAASFMFYSEPDGVGSTKSCATFGHECRSVRLSSPAVQDVVPWETDGESVLRESYRVSLEIRMTNTQTPPPATTVVIPTGAPATNTVANHAERPEKFNGQNFKRWQQKMFFYLTTLGLARFLKETAPQVEPPAEGQSSNAQAVQAVEAWKHSDFLCHNYVLNGLIDPFPRS
ncbi:hypothetical protein Tco_0111699 [Tanacetum coccineum]